MGRRSTILFMLALLGNLASTHAMADEACLADEPEARISGTGFPYTTMSLPIRTSSAEAVLGSEDNLVMGGGTQVSSFDPVSLGDEFTGASSGLITSATPVVKLDDGSHYLFVAREDGVLVKFNSGGGSPWLDDLTRGGGSGDALAAAPVVHLRRFASTAFQARYSTDLVYIGTAYSSSTANRIYTVNADTGSIVLIFNNSEAFEMDAVQGLTLDESDDVLYAATRQTADPTQHSLWALDVLTGTLLWSAEVGDLFGGEPLLASDRVYAVSVSGDVTAVDRHTGNIDWIVPTGTFVTSSSKIIESATGEVFIASVGFLGSVSLVRDDGDDGSLVWQIASLPGGAEAVPAALEVGLGGENLFVGGNDGRVYQLDVANGSVEASRLVVDGSAVGLLGIQEDHPADNRAPSLFASADDGTVSRFCQPFRVDTAPADTDGDGVTDGLDNCPADANPTQDDVDQDGIGNACDPDNRYFVSIGGTLSGLAPGTEVVLRDSSPAIFNVSQSDDLVLGANGTFSFNEFLLDVPFDYAVTVINQPTTPAQTCVVSNGNGTIAGEDISNVQVSCSDVDDAAYEALELAADSLTELLASALSDGDLQDIQIALDAVIGSQADIGALDSLDAGDPVGAISHIMDALKALEGVTEAGVEDLLSTARNSLGLSAESIAKQQLAQAESAIGAPNSREARSLERIQSLIDQGHGELLSEDYMSACRIFKRAAAKALSLQ